QPPRPPFFPYTTLFRSPTPDLWLYTHPTTSFARSRSLATRSSSALSNAAVENTVFRRFSSTFFFSAWYPSISVAQRSGSSAALRSEEHTSELQSRENLV